MRPVDSLDQVDTTRAEVSSPAHDQALVQAEHSQIPAQGGALQIPAECTASNQNEWPADYVQAFQRVDRERWVPLSEETVAQAMVATLRPMDLQEADAAAQRREKSVAPQRDAYYKADQALRELPTKNAEWRRVTELRRGLEAQPSGSLERAGITLLYQQALAAALQVPAYLTAKAARDATKAEYDRLGGGNDLEHDALFKTAPRLCPEIRDGGKIVAALFSQYPSFGVVPIEQWVSAWLSFIERCQVSNRTAAEFATRVFFHWALDDTDLSEKSADYSARDLLEEHAASFIALFEEHRSLARLLARLIARAHACVPGRGVRRIVGIGA